MEGILVALDMCFLLVDQWYPTSLRKQAPITSSGNPNLILIRLYEIAAKKETAVVSNFESVNFQAP